MIQPFTLPTLDENVTEYRISYWVKQVGDSFVANEPLLEVETDKVTMEVVAESDGVLMEQVVEVGMVVHSGAVLGHIEVGAIEEALLAEKVAARKQHKMTPVVARMVAENELDIKQIRGTGRDGRVTKKDVEAYLAQRKTTAVQPSVEPLPQVSASNGLTPLTGMRRSIAEHMVRSVQTSPHVTTVFEFDFSAVAAHRRQHKAEFAEAGIKLTYMAYITQATANALRRFPQVNSVFHGLEQGIELKPEINIGLIVAVKDGLYAPVIHRADQLNLRGLAGQIEDLAVRARHNQLKTRDLQGGTFTISNHGAAGSLLGTPIIFQPQVGILGVGKIEERIKIIQGAIHIRPLAYVSFSFDHRVMDGAVADGFVSDIQTQIENWT